MRYAARLKWSGGFKKRNYAFFDSCLRPLGVLANGKRETMNEYYHSREAATAHLQSVGLTFGGFLDWMYDKWTHESVAAGDGLIVYPASLLRQYIRENNKL